MHLGLDKIQANHYIIYIRQSERNKKQMQKEIEKYRKEIPELKKFTDDQIKIMIKYIETSHKEVMAEKN